MKKIRYGVLGFGHMGTYHVNVLSMLPDVELVGVCDEDPAKGKSAEEKYGVKSFQKPSDLIREVEALSICLPTTLHAAASREALEAGRHILIEKPMTPTHEEALELVTLAEQKKCLLHVGHVERFNGAVQELVHVVNEPLLWESRRLGPHSGRSLDTGVVMDLMIHDIDICLRVVNDDAVDVRSSGYFLPGSKHEDAAVAQVRFKKGCVASFTASRVTQEKIRTLSISQKESYLSLDFTTQDLQIHRRASSMTSTSTEKIRYRQEALIERLFIHKENPLRSELQFFIQNIRDAEKERPNWRRENEMDLTTLRIATQVRDEIRRAAGL